MNRWLMFANMNLVRLNQPAADGDQGGGSGAAGADDDQSAKSTNSDPAATDAGTSDKPIDEMTAEELREALQKAQADFEVQRRVNRNLDRRTKADLKKIEALTKQGKSPQDAEAQVDQEQALKQARAEERAEANTEYRTKLVEAHAKAALAGKVTDPQYAVWLLRNELPDVPVDDGGDVDEQALADMVEELLDKNPQLKVTAQGGTAAVGSPDGGARKADSKSEEQSLEEEIAAAHAGRDFVREIALKQRLAALRADNKKKG